MEQQIKDNLDKKDISQTSKNFYFNTLKRLNDKREIKNLKFLSKPSHILDKIKDYKLSSQRNIIISIVSVLKDLDEKLYKKYYKIMIDFNKQIDDKNKDNKKTDEQNENWISWDSVKNLYDDLRKKIKFNKNMSEDEYNVMLDAVLLGLYVELPPRRNKDYLLMKVSKDGKMNDDNYNYYNVKKNQFVFNQYKTSKTYGKQIIDIPDSLSELLKKYLRYKKNDDNFFLVGFDGKHFSRDNSITKRLNNIFGKKISSSMLRHIYLSKYKDVLDEQKKDSNAMAHSLNVQRDYIKN